MWCVFLRKRCGDYRCSAMVLVLVMGVMLVACQQRQLCDPLPAMTGFTMGTSYTVTLGCVHDNVDRGELQADIDRILARVNERMSTYDADSELSRFNRSRTTDWVEVSSELLTVIDAAAQVSRTTRGAFDVTVGGLVNLWGFGPSVPTALVPSDAAIAEVMDAIGYEHLRLRSSPPSLRKAVPGLSVDLSGIAKGYAVDAVSDYLASVGVANALVEIGGDLRANGEIRDGVGWDVVIERPVALRHERYRTFAVRDRAVATSGDYRNYIERDGKRFSHTIDPTTGKPIAHTLASVTVIAPTAMTADAFATALMVLGPDAGYALATREHIAALFLIRHDGIFREQTTSAWRRIVEWT